MWTPVSLALFEFGRLSRTEKWTCYAIFQYICISSWDKIAPYSRSQTIGVEWCRKLEKEPFVSQDIWWKELLQNEVVYSFQEIWRCIHAGRRLDWNLGDLACMHSPTEYASGYSIHEATHCSANGGQQCSLTLGLFSCWAVRHLSGHFFLYWLQNMSRVTGTQLVSLNN